LALDGDDLSIIDRLFDTKDCRCVRFARLSINTGTPTRLPRPSITPEDVRRRCKHTSDANHAFANPAPSRLSERVRKSLLQPTCVTASRVFRSSGEALCAFARYLPRSIQRLDGRVVNRFGHGRVESMVAGMVPEGGVCWSLKTACMANGSRRLHSSTGSITSVNMRDGRAGYDAIIRKLDGFTHAAIIHSRTTTGRLNRLDG